MMLWIALFSVWYRRAATCSEAMKIRSRLTAGLMQFSRPPVAILLTGKNIGIPIGPTKAVNWFS
jgi:hypothetical protein